MTQFVALMRDYCAPRAARDKHHLRVVDEIADSRSPMMVYGVPVGRMFLKGTPQLLRAPASVLPFDPVEGDRIIVEGYPALVKRRWIGQRGYKSDKRKKQTVEHELARAEIVAGLRSPMLSGTYGVELRLTDQQAQDLANEPTADELDAVLCAIQAAWAYTQREHGYGIPAGVDTLEGWIVDPLLLE